MKSFFIDVLQGSKYALSSSYPKINKVNLNSLNSKVASNQLAGFYKIANLVFMS